MSIEFKLPEVSEGVSSADVSDVLVSEGDVIEAGQLVVEVETEKAVAPVECPHAGRVAKIHVAAGDTIDIGATLLTIDDAGETKTESAPATASPEKSAEASSPSHSAPSSQRPPERKLAPPPAPPAGNGARIRGDYPPAPAAPSVRRLAREMGINLRSVSGSARGGRITAEDVRAFAENQGETTGTGIAVADRPRGGTMTTGSHMAPMEAPPLPDFEQFGPITRRKMNKLARTAASNLAYSWATIPHVTQHELTDITDLEAARRVYMAGAGAKGPKITMTAVMVKAVVAALREHPLFNSSLDLGSGEIVVKEYFHIGIAVDTEAGLVVPVIRDADRKTISEIAAEMTELAGKARERKLQMDDMRGATFTITNLGGIGGSSFTPIVNSPEVAILGMSRSQKQLELRDGEVVERLMLPLSLSYDHRVINGADAARFITTLGGSLADFMRLLVNA